MVSGHHRFNGKKTLLTKNRVILNAGVSRSNLVCAIFDSQATNLETSQPIIFEVENNYLDSAYEKKE